MKEIIRRRNTLHVEYFASLLQYRLTTRIFHLCLINYAMQFVFDCLTLCRFRRSNPARRAEPYYVHSNARFSPLLRHRISYSSRSTRHRSGRRYGVVVSCTASASGIPARSFNQKNQSRTSGKFI